jgi:hypothetical protein
MNTDNQEKHEALIRLARGIESNREYQHDNRNKVGFTDEDDYTYERMIKMQERSLAKLFEK